MTSSWPTRPPASVQDHPEFSFFDRIEMDYRAWRETRDGQLVFAEVERRALAESRVPGIRRISVNRIFENLRRDPPHWSINDHFRAVMARDLVALHVELRPLIKLRQRKAA